MHVSVTKLRDHLNDCLRHVENGEEIIITSHKKAVAKIVPITNEILSMYSRSDLIDDIARLHRKLKGVKLKSTMRDVVIQARNERIS